MKYIVITSRIVGGPERGYSIEHYSGADYAAKASAVRAGFEMYDSDDFFIGVLNRGKLSHCENIESDGRTHDDDLPEIAEQLGYPLTPPQQKGGKKRTR